MCFVQAQMAGLSPAQQAQVIAQQQALLAAGNEYGSSIAWLGETIVNLTIVLFHPHYLQS